MKRLSFAQGQRFNPVRHPAWRWHRAQFLVESRGYCTRRRDDRATSITVDYLRELSSASTEAKQRRVRSRYQHLDRARQFWEADDHRSLEVRSRLLARQGDVEIGLEMDLPAPTVQAYRDLFFAIDARIDASTYISLVVIGIHPLQPPTLEQIILATRTTTDRQ